MLGGSVGYLENYKVFTAEGSDYVKVGFGSEDGLSWIVFHSPSLGFGIHSNWLSEGQDSFSDALFFHYSVDDVLLSGGMVDLLRSSAGFDSDVSAEDRTVVFDVVEAAGVVARNWMNDVLADHHRLS